MTSNVPNYDETSKQVNLTVEMGTIDLNVTVVDASYPDAGKVIVDSSVDGNYTVIVDGKDYIVEVVDGSGIVTVDVLPVGEYPVNVRANISDYYPVDVSADDLVVSEGNIDMDVSVVDATYPDNATVVVKSDVDGNYTVSVGNKTYDLVVVNGTGNVTIDVLPSGVYEVNVTSNVSNYNKTTETTNITVNKCNINMNVTVTNATFPDSAIVSVKSDVDGEYIVEVNNKQYIALVENGTATVEIDQLPAGKYPVKVTSNISNYEAVSKETSLTVSPAKTADNVKITVTLRDSNGKVLKNKKVTFTYNGKTYVVKTDGKGVAKIAVKKSDVTTNTVINLKSINGKKVKSTIVSKFKYSSTFKNKKGKAIIGKKVTFKFNGKTYTAKTNKKGVATVTLKNVKAGNYKIIAKCGNIVHKATIKIKK